MAAGISPLFPHLPRADLRSFRLALGAGVALVVVLCLLRLYPLALVAAAVAVPLLFLLYLWDVDVYEEEPWTVLAFTVAWGALFGAGLGYAARRLPSEVALLRGSPDTHNLVWLGIVLPLAAYVLSLAGPLLLLPYRNFNDVMDGVTFGASSAATLLAAEAIVNSADFLHLGFRAAGDRWLWIARLLTLGVTMPVLAAGAGAAACGAFWLRFRAPVRDRGALGLLGSPLAATAAGAALLVGASVAELYLKQWITLLVTAALGAAALVWLRRLIALGLREEAAEAGARAEATTRHGGAAKVAAFAALAAATLGLTSLAIVLARPPAARPPCRPGVPCAVPPPGTPVAAPHVVAGEFRSGKTWTSGRGLSLRYGDTWDVVKSSASGLVLQASGSGGLFVVVAVSVAPASLTPADALSSEVDSQPDGFLGVQRDTSSAHVVLSPELGFVHGVAGMYSATVDSPPSPGGKVELAFEAASHASATVLVEAITNETAHGTSASSPFPVLEAVDELLTTLSWGGS